MADQKRDESGKFTSDEDGPTPVRESLEVGSAEDREAFEGSLEREGLSESEGADRLDALLQAAAETEGEEAPEGVDPEMWDSAREALEDTGSIEAAQAALEESLKGTEAAEHESADEDAPEPRMTWEELSEELDIAPEELSLKVKADGETEEVTLAEMERKYQKGKAFTRKTQELAEQRRELADQRREVQEAREAYAQQLEMLAVGLGQNLTPDQQDALRQRYNAVVSEIQSQTNEELTGSVQEEAQTLREKMGWDEPEAWDEARTNLRSYVTEDAGFSEEEASMVHDHRLLVLAEKARRYDQLAEQGEALVSDRPKQPGKTLTPGDQNPGRTGRAKRRKKVSDARKRLARTGSERDAAAAIEQGILGEA